VVIKIRVAGVELAISLRQPVYGNGEDPQQAVGALQLLHEVAGDEHELRLEVELAARAVSALIEH